MYMSPPLSIFTTATPGEPSAGWRPRGAHAPVAAPAPTGDEIRAIPSPPVPCTSAPDASAGNPTEDASADADAASSSQARPLTQDERSALRVVILRLNNLKETHTAAAREEWEEIIALPDGAERFARVRAFLRAQEGRPFTFLSSTRPPPTHRHPANGGKWKKSCPALARVYSPRAQPSQSLHVAARRCVSPIMPEWEEIMALPDGAERIAREACHRPAWLC